MRTAPARMPADLAAARTRIEKWRSSGRPRRRLPQAMWEMAADLVPAHGVYQVARALRLEYYKVREQAEARQAGRRKQAKPAKPSFVQVAPPIPAAVNSSVGSTVDLIDKSGRRMIIRSPGAADAVRLVATFFGAAS